MESYEVVKKIGEGCFGVVKLVRNRINRRYYAMKRIDMKSSSLKALKNAEKEAKLLSRLKHPNIVSYKESFVNDGALYIIMAYCDHGDLYTYIKHHKGNYFAEKQVIEWLIQILMALRYLHNLRILHRDLKTQNIFLNRNNIVRVGDLGIAKDLTNIDFAVTVIGSPFYMSPEIFERRPYSYASDVWALGCCTYEIMTHRHAYNAIDIMQLSRKVIEGHLPKFPSNYSSELCNLVQMMLKKVPEDRPTVNDLFRQQLIIDSTYLFIKQRKKVNDEKIFQRHRTNSLKNRSRKNEIKKILSNDEQMKVPLKSKNSPSEERRIKSRQSSKNSEKQLVSSVKSDIIRHSSSTTSNQQRTLIKSANDLQNDKKKKKKRQKTTNSTKRTSPIPSFNRQQTIMSDRLKQKNEIGNSSNCPNQKIEEDHLDDVNHFKHLNDTLFLYKRKLKKDQLENRRKKLIEQQEQNQQQQQLISAKLKDMDYSKNQSNENFLEYKQKLKKKMVLEEKKSSRNRLNNSISRYRSTDNDSNGNQSPVSSRKGHSRKSSDQKLSRPPSSSSSSRYCVVLENEHRLNRSNIVIECSDDISSSQGIEIREKNDNQTTKHEKELSIEISQSSGYEKISPNRPPSCDDNEDNEQLNEYIVCLTQTLNEAIYKKDDKVETEKSRRQSNERDSALSENGSHNETLTNEITMKVEEEKGRAKSNIYDLNTLHLTRRVNDLEKELKENIGDDILKSCKHILQYSKEDNQKQIIQLLGSDHYKKYYGKIEELLFCTSFQRVT
ncbi:hypothetical protein SNEBB_003749 [Seison nebaliae]|nr:hypothetical protein SNEBB_003749 [Seison nebaliae]